MNNPFSWGIVDASAQLAARPLVQHCALYDGFFREQPSSRKRPYTPEIREMDDCAVWIRHEHDSLSGYRQPPSPQPGSAQCSTLPLLLQHGPRASQGSAIHIRPSTAMTIAAAHGESSLSSRFARAAHIRHPCGLDELAGRPVNDSGYPSSTTFARSTAAAR